MRKTFYYSDELNDDFGTTVTKDKIKPLPANYQYTTTNTLGRAFDWLCYHGLAEPLAWLYSKVKLRVRYVNRHVIKKHKQGLFLFGNHTLLVGDACISNAAQLGRKNYIITGEQASSLTWLLRIMRAVGNIPLTDGLGQNVKMMRCIKAHLEQGATVTVFPEAHSWPYYTGVRPFPSTSFKYAVLTNAPVVCMTTCFKKRKFRKQPRITVYFDGPFYPKPDLSPNENAEYLRDVVYNCMRERTKEYSTYAYHTYLQSNKKSG